MSKKSEYRNSWIAEKLDRINLTVPKGEKEKIQEHAENQGESTNSFINRAIDETIERDTKKQKTTKEKTAFEQTLEELGF